MGLIFLTEKLIEFYERVFDDFDEKFVIYDKLKDCDYENKQNINEPNDLQCYRIILITVYR